MTPGEMADMLDGLAAELSDEQLDGLDATLLEAGHLGVAIIAARTKAGLDADGQPFTPYAPDYARLRERKGLSSQVDLARTGRMIGAQHVHVTGPNEVTIDFLSREDADKALWTHGGTTRKKPRPAPGLPQRSWFAIRRDEEIAEIGKVIGDGFTARIETVLK